MLEPESAAQSHVLATTELLELILLHLDATTLFAVQRVCRKWHSLISDSRKLQEQMFLRAPSKSQQFPTSTKDRIITVHYSDRAPYPDQQTEEVILCPVLDIATRFIRTQPGSIAAACNQSALRGSPSWHKMLLTIPPCKAATAVLWWRIGDSIRGSIYLESVTNAEGLRFADVVEAALKQTAGNWKELPDGELLPLSAAGGGQEAITLEDFLGRRAACGEDLRMMEATSVFSLKMG